MGIFLRQMVRQTAGIVALPFVPESPLKAGSLRSLPASQPAHSANPLATGLNPASESARSVARDTPNSLD
ncbi:hypothetical protein LBMAG46_14410 [Planctomycetia bacterium]|nr:hypothetical protein LBMAG46_14410 [Planctomycetia bacterium]